jgi:gliding motility-associated-like protein
MRTKFFFLYTTFWVLSNYVYAQSPGSVVLNSAGGSNTLQNITYEWSIGEMALVESMLGVEYSLTNGFLQPLKILPADVLNGYNIIANNLLSPNGDGVNDTWTIQYLDQYPENEVSVFNRNGERIFYTKNYQNNWDGKLPNQEVAENTYYYIIKLLKSGKFGFKKGYLTIITD